MKLHRKDSPRIAALAAALFMVGAGVFLCRFGSPVASSTALAGETPSPAQEHAREAAAPAPESDLPSGDPGPAPQSDSAQNQQRDDASQATALPSSVQVQRRTSAPSPAAVPRKAVPSGSLPPFQPAPYGGRTGDAPAGPPPGVLWLSGIIRGDPNLAIIRRGENRYLVREGSTIESGYQVVEISPDRVVLKRRGAKRVLRIGQY